jgi:hypothetical protein
MNPEEQVLISSAGKSPTIVQGHRDGLGVALFQGRHRVYLDGPELERFLAAVERPPTTTTPSKSRLVAYPVDD